MRPASCRPGSAARWSAWAPLVARRPWRPRSLVGVDGFLRDQTQRVADPLLVVGVVRLGRELLLLSPIHVEERPRDGVARDLEQTRYQTFEDLATYCYGVASTVGLMSMYIVGFKTNDAVAYAIKLGVALQMTNILRDVGEDYRNGRLYLPREELAYFGIREDDIATGRVTDTWRQFMKFQLERTRQLYADSWEGVKLLEREGQLAIGAASVFYQGILDQIENNDYDVFTRRASINTIGKISRIPALWLKIKTL